ncbi:MAG: hypothetical protein GWP06_06800 [Actinobacteria bacterium]|nr:hypothetical protein [Actinomycetota bacterium]
MFEKSFKKIIVYLSLLILITGLSGSNAKAQNQQSEYIIGPGDLLAVNFWQKPEFNVQVRVSASGKIELPLIGTLQASGFTAAKLRNVIEGRISLLDVKVTQVAVLVKKFGSKSVYVTGAVIKPGKVNFEVIPGVWQIILEAGGPLPAANLDDVAIVRGSGKNAGHIIHVNLAEALEKGDISKLPSIYPLDTIHIGSTNVKSPGMTVPSPLEQRELVYVFGQVATPGSFNLQKNMNLLDALVLAGGPTENADLKKVKLIFRGRRQAELAIVNMDKYLNGAVPIPLILHPGDAIYVPQKRKFLPSAGDLIQTLLYLTATYVVYRL